MVHKIHDPSSSTSGAHRYDNITSGTVGVNYLVLLPLDGQYAMCVCKMSSSLKLPPCYLFSTK